MVAGTKGDVGDRDGVSHFRALDNPLSLSMATLLTVKTTSPRP
ncbi:hypothetical protein COLO4_07837 [Corchorus olitorius]|uniref:Uncharacterized protein n=1 Tax=Corchorus olitorius TaxID=93759 RepID=A0A1R3KIE2_9ROSI|nr:hypothetical protein COLO4_07837 [Corchorus olitorius]